MVFFDTLILAIFGVWLFCTIPKLVFSLSPRTMKTTLFAGLNAIPKRAFLTEYSCRIDPAAYPKLMRGWFDAVTRLGIERGSSFDLDFHTIPFHGEDALV